MVRPLLISISTVVDDEIFRTVAVDNRGFAWWYNTDRQAWDKFIDNNDYDEEDD